MKQKFLLLYALLLCVSSAMAGGLKLPQLFQDGMVLQRGVDIPVWGWADAGQTVTVSLADAKGKVLSSATTTAGTDGCWRVELPKNRRMKAGGPYTLEFRTTNSISIKDVLLGDVWLLSGQSNIDVTIERVYPIYTDEIDDFSLDGVRLFRVQNDTSTHGVKDDIRPTSINWKPLTKENAWLFSAVGSFLGKRMFLSTGVPQGIIVNSWGGTPIEAWISADSLKRDYPMLVKKTQFFQNDSYVRAQMQANGEASRRWNEMLNQADDVQNYSRLSYQDADWQEIDQKDWNWWGTGSVWLRQHITIDKAHAGRPARLLLGTLYDQDVTYLNGQQIGQTGYQYPPRRYDIPEGLLQEGDNVIAIRFINKSGAAHFIPEKPYLLCFGDDRLSQNPMPRDVIPLGTTWKMHVGAQMPSCPSGDVSLQNLPTTLYNAVLHPLAPFALSGVVWYQGESNVGNPSPYADYLTKLIGCWRDRWQRQDLPFVVVQLANYDGRQQTGRPSPIVFQSEPVNSNWARLREAQRLTSEKLPYVELATAIDLGETVDIHPLRKKEVAERIGACFDRMVYSKRVALSPRVAKTVVNGRDIRLILDQPMRSEAELRFFEVAGADGRYHNATARQEGAMVILISSPVDQPRSLRYAWKDNPLGLNVYNPQGWPLLPQQIEL